MLDFVVGLDSILVEADFAKQKFYLMGRRGFLRKDGEQEYGKK